MDHAESGLRAKAATVEAVRDRDAIQILMGPAERCEIVSVQRNRNPKQRGVYEEAKAKIRKCTIQRGECATAQLGGLPAGLTDLDGSVNEFLLFHGTSATAAKSICADGFNGGLSGVGRSNLLNFGKGIYFAETSSKANQFSREEGGIKTMLICRVTCGHMRRSADWAGGPHSRGGTPPQSRQNSRRGTPTGTPTGSRRPTPPGTPCASRTVSGIVHADTLPALMEALQASLGPGDLPERKQSKINGSPKISGICGEAEVFHSTLGHRETSSGFHREFVLEDADQAFIEYVVHYSSKASSPPARRLGSVRSDGAE